jgi:hypothetical protein
MKRALWPGDEYLLSKVEYENDRQRQGAAVLQGQGDARSVRGSAVTERVLLMISRVPPRYRGHAREGTEARWVGPSLFWGMSAYRTVRSGASE